jgi:uncharacterized protein
MARLIAPAIQRSVRDYSRMLTQRGVPVTKLVLFGSYAKGTEKPTSDIDVAVIAPTFGHDLVSEMRDLLVHAWSVNSRIEPYPLSVEEYEHGFSPITNEIRKHGIEVAL